MPEAEVEVDNYLILSSIMLRVLSALIGLILCAPAVALTGNAPPASGYAARAIVMVVDPRGDLCTGTALARDLVVTAAHCVTGKLNYQVKTFQTGQTISVRAIAPHPHFDLASYAASRATADVALLKLSAPLADLVMPAKLAPARRVGVGETLTIAGFGVTADGTPRGLGIPRMATLTVTGKPGNLQIRLYDLATRNQRIGLGACTGRLRRTRLRADEQNGHRRGELVHRARRPRRLRRPYWRYAVLALPRLDLGHRAQVQFTGGAVTNGLANSARGQSPTAHLDFRRAFTRYLSHGPSRLSALTSWGSVPMKHSAIAAALAFALLAAAPASASPVTAQGVTRGEVAEILAAHGMPAKLKNDSKGNEIVSSSVSGINFDVYFYDCNSGRCSSIQFAAGWTNSNASQARINEWNTTKRYLRVYSKPGKIIWAEQDLVVSQGTTENIDDCLTWWEKMITQFKTFMKL